MIIRTFLSRCILLLVFAVSFYGCKDRYDDFQDLNGWEDDGEVQLQKDIILIEEYLADNNLSADSLSSGLYYIIDETGSGIRPDPNSVVEIRLNGYLLDGSVFDNNWNPPVTRFLDEGIEGLQKGVPLFKEGGKGRLIVPSGLGFQGSQFPGVPSYSVLIYDIELISVW